MKHVQFVFSCWSSICKLPILLFFASLRHNQEMPQIYDGSGTSYGVNNFWPYSRIRVLRLSRSAVSRNGKQDTTYILFDKQANLSFCSWLSIVLVELPKKWLVTNSGLPCSRCWVMTFTWWTSSWSLYICAIVYSWLLVVIRTPHDSWLTQWWNLWSRDDLDNNSSCI